jgi:endonuclease YncB( thermonuclease family)
MRVLALFLVLLATAARAAEVADVPDGATLVLADARRIRLAGIDAAPSPVAARTLRALALGKDVALEPVGPDRHGRLRAQVRTGEGLWLQGELLRRGLARVRTGPDERSLAEEMLALEAAAREAGRGGWTHPAWTVRSPADIARFTDSWQLVEGRVLAAARVRGQVFLNFGSDRRTDFTVRIAAPALKLCREAGLDPLALEGTRIRVRGWVRVWDGPLIDLTHPEQVERLR